jgi:tetratricopeptide (TPR) repeat protein
MTSQHGRAVKTKLDREHARLSLLVDSAPCLVLNSLVALESELRTCTTPEDLSPDDYFGLLLHLASLQIDAAARRTGRDALAVGMKWAEETNEAVDASTGTRAHASYSLANSILELHQIELTEFRKAPVTKASLKRAPFELAQRDQLSRVRRLLAEAGDADSLGPLERSRALCDLGNVLDESGRWVEAYEAYVDALAASPSNGNAAGNAAELLRRRLNTGHGLRGHYAAVYNKYAARAKALRPHTVTITVEARAVPGLAGVERCCAGRPGGSAVRVVHAGRRSRKGRHGWGCGGDD